MKFLLFNNLEQAENLKQSVLSMTGLVSLSKRTPEDTFGL
ncbi:hypothetical protein XBP1_1810001 [Xenorhabdus bovienii str. puntauvense]|uniref:Uncharacterized protein n=2 Tax=Xenorhabdus bovienii TaxID=40576 RepID=A0A0B6XG50_XENBV|nr:hypothetical protein XBP1_1810001 [Xenorhabdus bovienii str. puntauvense]CDM91488.1 protein of unknown function [Xenorhabdus bovienii]CDM91953.1 protein of unknown function [Xenorhabdus bovienii]